MGDICYGARYNKYKLRKEFQLWVCKSLSEGFYVISVVKEYSIHWQVNILFHKQVHFIYYMSDKCPGGHPHPSQYTIWRLS